VSDFRGFIFDDSNLGLRLFGNYDNNRCNTTPSRSTLREKDTYSDLNKFRLARSADHYPQRFPPGFSRERLHRTAQLPRKLRWRLTALRPETILSPAPAPIGAVRDHYVQAYYPRLDRRRAYRGIEHQARALRSAGRRWISTGSRSSEFQSTPRWRRSSCRSTRTGFASNFRVFMRAAIAILGTRTVPGFDTIFDKPFFCRRHVQLFRAPGIQSGLARR